VGGVQRIEDRVDSFLWPFVDEVVRSWALPGLSVGVVFDREVGLARGFGSADPSGRPVTADTLFHQASISKPFVATGVLRLVEAGELELDGRVTTYLHDLDWADPRAASVTIRQLLSHTSGCGDVHDYGWHRPQLDDAALARFSADVAGWPLDRDPGSGFAYSNAAYEVLGHIIAVVTGQSFEDRLREDVLRPAGMTTSTFSLPDVPGHLGALPHLGLPPRVVDGAYPFTRPHAPSSSLHSSATEMNRWTALHLADGPALLTRATRELMWRPVAEVGWSEWHQSVGMGWFSGTHRGHRCVGHSGDDPGFQANLTILPDLGMGVCVMADSNTAPIFGLTRAALDTLLGVRPDPPPAPPVTVPLAAVLEESGVEAAVAAYARLARADPPTVDLGDEGFEDAVWGAIEMHRTDLVWPVIELWRSVRPDSSSAWFMTGWAHEVDGRRSVAVEDLRRAVRLDPENADARTMLRRLAPDAGSGAHPS
jgi:CubicO group peptidase (beta-lactamase class C family)